MPEPRGSRPHDVAPASDGGIWYTAQGSGELGWLDPKTGETRHPATGRWREWRLPGERPAAYAVFVDDQDLVWLTDFGANALVRFDPATERFESFPHPAPGANVRQLLGRPGEVLGALSGQDKLVVARR